MLGPHTSSSLQDWAKCIATLPELPGYLCRKANLMFLFHVNKENKFTAGHPRTVLSKLWGPSNLWNSMQNFSGHVSKHALWMKALTFIIGFLTPKVISVGKLQAQEDATMCHLQNETGGFLWNAAHSPCWPLPKWLSNNFACRTIYFISHLKPNSTFTWSLFQVHSYRVSVSKKEERKANATKICHYFPNSEVRSNANHF